MQTATSKPHASDWTWCQIPIRSSNIYRYYDWLQGRNMPHVPRTRAVWCKFSFSSLPTTQASLAASKVSATAVCIFRMHVFRISLAVQRRCEVPVQEWKCRQFKFCRTFFHYYNTIEEVIIKWLQLTWNRCQKFVQGDSQNTEHQSRHDEHWCPPVSEKLPTVKHLTWKKLRVKVKVNFTL